MVGGKIKDTTKIEVNHESIINSDTGFTSTGKSYSTSVGSMKGVDLRNTSTKNASSVNNEKTSFSSHNKNISNVDFKSKNISGYTKGVVRKTTETLTEGIKDIADSGTGDISKREVSNWGARESAKTLGHAGELALKAGYSTKEYIDLSRRVKNSKEIKAASMDLKTSINNFKEGSLKANSRVLNRNFEIEKKYGVPKSYYKSLAKSKKQLKKKALKKQKKNFRKLKKQKKLEIMQSKKYRSKVLKADSKRLLKQRMIKDTIKKAENIGADGQENNMSTSFTSYLGGVALEKIKHAVMDTINKLLIKILKILTAGIFSIAGITIIAFSVLLLFLSSYQSKVEAGNYQSMYIFLRQKGFSAEGACGILGNIRQESDGNADCSTGEYFGLCQWNKAYYSDLFEKPDWKTAQVQMEYLVENLNTGAHCNGGTKLGEYLKKSKDTSISAQEFCAGYEKCVNGSDTYTGNLYPEYKGVKYQELNKRVAYAIEFFNLYKDVLWEGVDINLNLSNVINVFNITANDFINEIKVYNQGLTTRMKRNGFKTRADCSGFVYYYMSTVSGSDSMSFVPATSYMLIPSNFGSISTGWQGKKISELKGLNDLKAGDVLVGINHTEVYFGPNKSWGWGSVKTTAEPGNTLFVFDGSNVIQQTGNYKKSYSVVYRYGGF